MKLKNCIPQMAISASLGLANYFLLVYCWAFIAAYSPLPHWLIDVGLRDNAFRSVLFPVDFAASVLLCLPVGLILARLRPDRIWLYLGLAVLPGFVWRNASLISNPDFLQLWLPFTLGLVPELLALPVATVLVRIWRKPGAPDNSFKSKPLRGST